VHWDGAGRRQQVVVIDWMTLRNPRAAFSEKRPRLPGREHPGLEIGEEVLELLVRMARRLEKDEIVNFPEHYHNAFLYGAKFRYCSPELQGRVMAIARDMEGQPLDRISWAIDWGCLRERPDGRAVPWSEFRGEQILPISRTFSDYFSSEAYWDEANRAAEAVRYEMDWDGFEKILARRRAAGDPDVPKP